MAACKHVTAYRSRQPERAKYYRLQRALLALWRKDSVSVKLWHIAETLRELMALLTSSHGAEAGRPAEAS